MMNGKLHLVYVKPINVNIEGKYPIWVKNASVLELTLVGNNDIKATSGAGICVPAGTTLELKGSGKAFIFADSSPESVYIIPHFSGIIIFSVFTSLNPHTREKYICE